jgi:integrase
LSTGYVREKPIAGDHGKEWKPKTGDHRVVPLSPNLIKLFSGLVRRNCPWVFPRPSRNPERPGFMPINDRNVLSHLKALLRQLNLPGHVHTFRHSFISHALIQGVPEALVRQWVGHVDPATIRNYTHIADKDSHTQMERLFPALKQESDPQPLNDYSI